MKQTPMQEVLPVGTKEYYRRDLWSMLLAGVLLAGASIALDASWGDVSLPMLRVALAAVMGIAACVLGGWLKNHHPLFNTALWVLPWVLCVVHVAHSGADPWRGAQFWLNLLITRWNAAHAGGVALFPVQAVQGDVNCFSIMFVLLTTQVIWRIVSARKVFAAGVVGFFWLFVMVFGNCYDPLAAALLLAAVLCTACTAPHVRINPHTAAASVVLTGALCLCAVLLPQGELPQVRTLRLNMERDVYTLRYGEKTLPEGDLYAASTLQSGAGEMLTVETQQEKSFYLRGFVGTVYSDGVWQPLPDAALGGDNAGMLKWLAGQGFDPLTQSATYWALDDETPEANKMSVQVSGAARYYLYAPVSLADAAGKEVNGETLRTRGLFGDDSYTYTEVSDYRPAELVVASPWVTTPRTDAQRRYSEAESVYRRFVYENYTALDADTNDLMQTLFWQDYAPEADGIYSAITRVRQVLKRQVSYDETAADAPENVDPVRYFLTMSRRGNAALYASATVQALRAHGIPARYVEGYYLPSTAVGDGTVTLTGQNAHAWAEAYFDGVGWLPLDTTPGCYLETVALQQMVGAPDAVRKTAALQENDREAAQITGEDASGQTGTPPLETAKNVTILLLGVLALALMLLAVVLACAEVLRGVRYRLALRAYQKAAPERRAQIMQRYLYKMLHIYGFDAALGWNTAQLDAALAKQCIELQPGDYRRACALIEKTVYGGEAPDKREERALQGFLQKLAASSREESLLKRLQLRYSCP